MDYFSSKNFEIVTGSAASLKLVVGNRISQVHIRNFFSKCNFFGGNDIMFLQKNLRQSLCQQNIICKGKKILQQ